MTSLDTRVESGRRPPAAERLPGVDAARALALLGMMATHLFSFRELDGSMSPAYAIADGRASALFAVLAGMSLALADGGSRAAPRVPYAVMLGRVAIRAVLIGLVGLLLAELGTPILVILTYYAVLFLLVAPFLRLPAAALAGLAVTWAVLGPVVSHVIRRAYDLDVVVESPSFGLLVGDPGELGLALLLTGTYPALTWLAYALAGAALGRAVLSVRALAVVAATGLALAVAAYLVSDRLLAAGAAQLAQASGLTGDDPAGRFFGTTPTTTWWWLAVGRPHSGTPWDLLATTGSSVLVIAVMMLLVRGRLAGAWMWLTAAGSMTLSLYSLHLVFVAAGIDVWLVQVVVVLIIGLAWRALVRRGPLEAVVAAAVDAVLPRRRWLPPS